MMKYGLECEYWVVTDIVDDGWSARPEDFRLVPKGLPKDECGYLAEVRGDPHHDIDKAIALYDVERVRVAEKFAKQNLLIYRGCGSVQLPLKFLREAMRLNGKPAYPQGRGNIYGKDYKVRDRWSRAGLHVHFSDECLDDDGKIRYRMIDYVKYIQAFDKAFAEEIKVHKRLPGFYEMKPHGFEYRSLPCCVDFDKVAEVIKKLNEH